MAWNGSGRKTVRRTQKKNCGFTPIKIGMISVCVVGIVVLFIAVLQSERKDPFIESQKKSRSVPDVAHKSVGLARKQQPKSHRLVDNKEIKRRDKRGTYTNMYGYVMNRPSTAVVITNKVAEADKPLEERVFRNSADQKIAGLLLLEPGEMMIGDATTLFGESFTRSFIRSLKSPIEIFPDDDNFTIELKQAVKETKIELKSRIDAGEDIGALLLDEQKKLQELGLFKLDLQNEIAKIARSEDLTEEEMNEFVTAANKMLESRGGSPLEMPRLAARRFQLIRERNQNTEGVIQQ